MPVFYFWRRVEAVKEVRSSTTPKVPYCHAYPVTFLSGKPREAVETSVSLEQHSDKWLVLQLLQTRCAL